ncbi:magnesium/cobalt transporter CorA [Flagellimonas sp. S174]|uniref:magnesium/cobalt transporter CorA n=1 Tax=Flagellimonas sp. S174 TaxID=3410790 RepID=UPI003BF60786
MARFLKKRIEKLGTAPGSLNFVGTQKVDAVQLEMVSYNSKEIFEKASVELKNISRKNPDSLVSWLNIVGIHDVTVIAHVGAKFDLHSLLQEDILNTAQRPKFEEFDNHLFLVVKMLHFDSKEELITAEQLSLVIGKNLLISFQEVSQDVFDPIRERLLRPTTKIRNRSSDYLAFAMLDTIVDQYMVIIENIGERIEVLEDRLLKNPAKEHLEKIYFYKTEINFLRKTIRPVRELVSKFKRTDSELIDRDTVPYLKDLEDNITHASEAIEIYKEMLNDQLDIYNSALNNKLNDIIRVLTVFSVVFIPLTFLAGIYGTNFKYLPELDYIYAYPIFWLILVFIAVGMILFFKKRKWL